MALDNVLFLVGQGKHNFSVIACNARVLKAMPVRDIAAIMPVIQVKIMQERTFYQAGLVGVGTQMDVEPECNARDPHTMLVGRHTAVLDELLHFQRVGVVGNAL